MFLDDGVERSASERPTPRPGVHEAAGAPVAHTAVPAHAIDAHVAQWIGPVSAVRHLVAADRMRIDVLAIEATPERPHRVLVTRGLSARPMAVPGGLEDERRVELLIALPSDGLLAHAAFDDARQDWALHWLERIAQQAHGDGRWIGWGQVIANGDPPEPIADTPFAGVMLLPPYRLPAGLFRLETGAGDTVTFLQLVPLHAGEIAFQRREGAGALEALFLQRDVDLVVDPQRPDLTRSARRSWWPFRRA